MRVGGQFSPSGNGFNTILFSFREWFQYSFPLFQAMVSVQFSSLSGNGFNTVFFCLMEKYLFVLLFGPSNNEFSPPLWFPIPYSFLLSQEMILVQFSLPLGMFQCNSPLLQEMVSAQFSFSSGREWFQCSSLLQGMVSAQFSSSGNGFSAVLFFREMVLV